MLTSVAFSLTIFCFYTHRKGPLYKNIDLHFNWQAFSTPDVKLLVTTCLKFCVKSRIKLPQDFFLSWSVEKKERKEQISFDLWVRLCPLLRHLAPCHQLATCLNPHPGHTQFSWSSRADCLVPLEVPCCCSVTCSLLTPHIPGRRLVTYWLLGVWPNVPYWTSCA